MKDRVELHSYGNVMLLLVAAVFLHFPSQLIQTCNAPSTRIQHAHGAGLGSSVGCVLDW